MKLSFPSLEQQGVAFGVALLAALTFRFAVGVAGWVDLGGLLIAAALLFGLAVLAERRRLQSDQDAAAQRAAEARAESRITAAMLEFEQLKTKVSKLQNMAGLQ